jgi:hypothetical protein
MFSAARLCSSLPGKTDDLMAENDATSMCYANDSQRLPTAAKSCYLSLTLGWHQIWLAQ